MTEHSIAALSEMERLGQKALDAIFAEHQVTRPEVSEILKAAQAAGELGAKEVHERAEAAAGGNLVGYLLTTMRAADDRARAVSEYLTVRRVLTASGVL